jgi:hypothetical protein
VKYVIYIQRGPFSKQQKLLEHSLLESVLAFVSTVSVKGTTIMGRLGILLLTWEETTLQVQVVGSTHFTQHCSQKRSVYSETISDRKDDQLWQQIKQHDLCDI